MKNITLSADEKLIEAAREKARREHSTLNAEFRRWLEQYAPQRLEGEARVRAYREAMEQMKDVRIGRRYTREEMNERR